MAKYVVNLHHREHGNQPEHTAAGGGGLGSAGADSASGPGSLPPRPSVSSRPSVSLHVRGGDSCDVVLTYEVPHMTNYLNTSGRPCFR